MPNAQARNRKLPARPRHNKTPGKPNRAPRNTATKPSSDPDSASPRVSPTTIPPQNAAHTTPPCESRRQAVLYVVGQEPATRKYANLIEPPLEWKRTYTTLLTSLKR